MKTAVSSSPDHAFQRRGFTLIEIMVVVAIMGLIMALGLPSILSSMKKEGMRKAVSDIEDCCYNARSEAIMQNKTVSVVFHPLDKTFAVDNTGGAGFSADKVSSSTLPAGIEFTALDINLMDFNESEWGKVRFFPDGTSDELRIVLLGNGKLRMITLEFATGIPSASEVER